MSWDCSELSEAARLLDELLPAGGGQVVNKPPAISTRPSPRVETPASPAPIAAPPDEHAQSPYRGDRLEGLLRALCRRAGFEGAVVADAHGLPLAEADSPVDAERVAAFSSVLGESLDQAENLLGGHAANNVSVDFNYTDKLVLRQFPVDDGHFYLAVICPQEVDERGELELTLEQITDLLSVDQSTDS